MSKLMISAILVIAFVAFVQAKVYYGPGLSEPASYGPYNYRERKDLRDGRLFDGGPNRRDGVRVIVGGGGRSLGEEEQMIQAPPQHQKVDIEKVKAYYSGTRE